MKVHEYTSGVVSAILTESTEPGCQPTLVLVNTCDRSVADGVTRTPLDPSRLKDIVSALDGLRAILAGEPPCYVRDYVDEREQGGDVWHGERGRVVGSDDDPSGNPCPSCGDDRDPSLTRCQKCGWNDDWMGEAGAAPG
jgi:hypothetical protein